MIKLSSVIAEGPVEKGQRSGHVHLAVLEDHPDLSGFDLYIAGPPAMIKVARESFLAFKLLEQNLFIDQFDPSVQPGLFKKLSKKWFGS